MPFRNDEMPFGCYEMASRDDEMAFRCCEMAFRIHKNTINMSIKWRKNS